MPDTFSTSISPATVDPKTGLPPTTTHKMWAAIIGAGLGAVVVRAGLGSVITPDMQASVADQVATASETWVQWGLSWLVTVGVPSALAGVTTWFTANKRAT